jgi:protein kinase C substrate 80K-H
MRDAPRCRPSPARCLFGLVCVAGSLTAVLAAAPVRGVPRSEQSNYSDGVTCIPRDAASPSAAAVHVPFERINDNYCDCEDGSDEPGTPASCDNARFFCANDAHKGAYIPSAHVGDGACDCCDGSDEAEGACPDVCAAEGEKALREANAAAGAIVAGVAARAALASEGLRAVRGDRKELALLKGRLAAVGPKIAAAEARVELLRTARDDAERQRTARAAGQAAAPPPPAAAQETAAEAPAAGGGDSEAGGGDSEAGVGDSEADDEDTSADGEGVADDDEGLRGPDLDVAPVGVEGGRQVAGQGAVQALAAGLDSSDAGENSPSDGDRASAPPDPPPPAARGQPGDEDALCAELAGSGATNPLVSTLQYYQALGLAKLRRVVPAAMLPSLGAVGADGAAAHCLERAEAALRRLRDDKSDDERKVAGLEARLATDYGADKALRALHGKCVKQAFTQYEFELCGFEHVQQYEHGSVIARLGSWGSWKGGGGAGGGEMVFDGGDQCWNGPKRSTTVRMECGERDEIVSVDEPNRCMYAMVFKTPAACHARQADAILAEAAVAGEARDEL